MPRQLREGEVVSFVQTRAPLALWRQVRAQAVERAPNGTATSLCTEGMLEFLKGRRWTGGEWTIPPRSENNNGAKGITLINLPLSNLDGTGRLIVDGRYLAEHNLLPLVAEHMEEAGRVLKSEQREFAPLVKLMATEQGVSSATFCATFLEWLAGQLAAPSQ